MFAEMWEFLFSAVELIFESADGFDTILAEHENLTSEALSKLAKQFKRMRRSLRKLRTWVGRLQRELERQLEQLPAEAKDKTNQLINLAKRLIEQVKNTKTKSKLYSLHEQEVDCISKGKARKRYEFGTKVGIVCMQKENFVTGMRRYPGNPYDGHTLDNMLQQSEVITSTAA